MDENSNSSDIYNVCVYNYIIMLTDININIERQCKPKKLCGGWFYFLYISDLSIYVSIGSNVYLHMQFGVLSCFQTVDHHNTLKCLFALCVSLSTLVAEAMIVPYYPPTFVCLHLFVFGFQSFCRGKIQNKFMV